MQRAVVCVIQYWVFGDAGREWARSRMQARRACGELSMSLRNNALACVCLCLCVITLARGAWADNAQPVQTQPGPASSAGGHAGSTITSSNVFHLVVRAA